MNVPVYSSQFFPLFSFIRHVITIVKDGVESGKLSLQEESGETGSGDGTKASVELDGSIAGDLDWARCGSSWLERGGWGRFGGDSSWLRGFGRGFRGGFRGADGDDSDTDNRNGNSAAAGHRVGLRGVSDDSGRGAVGRKA
jgi:hypothetical protein